jgi:hypothetical protein
MRRTARRRSCWGTRPAPRHPAAAALLDVPGRLGDEGICVVNIGSDWVSGIRILRAASAIDLVGIPTRIRSVAGPLPGSGQIHAAKARHNASEYKKNQRPPDALSAFVQDLLTLCHLTETTNSTRF